RAISSGPLRISSQASCTRPRLSGARGSAQSAWPEGLARAAAHSARSGIARSCAKGMSRSNRPNLRTEIGTGGAGGRGGVWVVLPGGGGGCGAVAFMSRGTGFGVDPATSARGDLRCAGAACRGAATQRIAANSIRMGGEPGRAYPPRRGLAKRRKRGHLTAAYVRCPRLRQSSDRHAGDIRIGLLLQVEGAAALRGLVGAVDGP